MEHRPGSKVYSEDNDCWYRIVRGRPNICQGCVFNGEDDNGEDECEKPDDLGDEESCVADEREDGIDIIYREL